MIYIIVRRAVLMEDEGRDHIIKSCQTKEEAQAWVAAQAGEYFGPRDYIIGEVQE